MPKPRKRTDVLSKRRYHHGNLVEALLAAAVQLIEKDGVERLSLRDVSKRVGVSPGAPFRHFKNKAELLTAIAEQSMSSLTESVTDALQSGAANEPLAKLHAIGRGYLAWALGNPTHFQIISSRTLINFHASKILVDQNEAIRRLMLETVVRGQAAASIRNDASAHDIVVNARAFAYGLARMAIDGHFREWKVKGVAKNAAEKALKLYVGMLKAPLRQGGTMGSRRTFSRPRRGSRPPSLPTR